MLMGFTGGEYYVVYPDGRRSEGMTRPVAQDYALIFGGHVKKNPSRYSWVAIKDWFRVWWNE